MNTNAPRRSRGGHTNGVRLGRWLAPLAALALVVTAAPAGAQVAPPDATIAGYATGSTVHLHALEAGTDASAVRIANSDVAFSAAAVNSGGLGTPVSNELGLRLYGPMPDKVSTARGSGLELSLAGEVPEGVNDVILAGEAQASAPPASELVTNEVGPVDLSPLAAASLLRGQAQASFTNQACVLGQDLSFGLGYAAGAQLVSGGGGDGGLLPGLPGLPGIPGLPALPGLDGLGLGLSGAQAAQVFDSALVGTNADDPARSVSQTRSRTFLAAQTDSSGARVGNHAAVASEVRQTIAPVTLFEGTPTEITIELLGEWVLRATATGIPGTGHVQYGPADASPETPVVRVIEGGVVNTILTLQDLLGEAGLGLPINPLIDISIGEAPRAIGGEFGTAPTISADGTFVAAAVDAVRVEVLDLEGVAEVADVRVGHMEATAQAPAGGVLCRIPVEKVSSTPSVEPGETFTYTITVRNPYSCPLNDVRVVDDISATQGVLYSVTGTEPTADQVSQNQVVWEGRGPIPPGGSATFTIRISVNPSSGAGSFTDTAAASGVCGSAPVTGEVDVRVPVTGDTTVQGPVVDRGPLPATGGGAALFGMAALAAAGILRRKLF